MKSLFLGLLLSIYGVFAQQTQTITGVVSNDFGILEGANVILKETKQGVITDKNGYFKLETTYVGTLHLEVSYIGYKTYRKTVRAGQQLKIYLEEESQGLEEVVVSAKSKARKLKEEAMPTTVINIQQLSGKATNVADVLAKTTGVTIRNSGGVGSASRLSLRGLEGKRIGLFIDETPINDSSDFVGLNDIPVDMIERIEIYKGVVPARFGGNAMGGVVNIVMKDYPPKYASINYTHGSFNTNTAELIFKRNLKEQGLLFGVEGFYTSADNDYIMKLPFVKNKKVKRTHDKFHKMLVGTALKATKWWFDEMTLACIILNTKKEIQGIKTDIREAHTKAQSIVLGSEFEKDDFFVEGLDFDMSLVMSLADNKLIDKTKKWYDWNGNAYETPSQYGGELNSFPSDYKNKGFYLVNKTNMEYLINTQHSITATSYFTLVNAKPKDELKKLSVGKETLFNSKMRSWVGGVSYDFRTEDDAFLNSVTFRMYQYQMNTKRADILSFKTEDIAINQFDYGISNAMRYKFTPSIMGKLSVGRDVRIPNQNELLGDGVFILPAENLLPEQNTSVNVGLLYQQQGGNHIQIEVSGFYMYLENMIRFTKSLFGAQYQNFGKMKTLGVEAEIKADIFPFLYGYVNATYQDLRDVREFEPNSKLENPTKNKRMPNIPYLMANMGLEFHKKNLFGGNGQNTRIFADLSFIEEYLYDFEMTKLSQRRIPRNTTIDVGFEHSFMNQHLFLSGNIRNLTNAEVLSEFNRPLPNRNFNIKLRYIFR